MQLKQHRYWLVIVLTALLQWTVAGQFVQADEVDDVLSAGEQEALDAAQDATSTPTTSTTSPLDDYLQFDGGKNYGLTTVERLTFLSGADDPVSVTIRLINISLSFLGVISTLLFVYAGVIWFAARDNEERVAQAKQIIRGALIGMLLTLGALSISVFVFNVIQDIVFVPTTDN